MGMRREGRELALQILYSLDLNPIDTRESLRQMRENLLTTVAVRNFAEELITGVAENRDLIDSKINDQSKNWSLSRITRVDLNILRIAVFELLFRDDIPKNVTINEAIEVAKKFGSEDSSAFINGILDEIGALIPEKNQGS